MKRYGMTVRLKPDWVEEYKAMYAAVWPQVIATLAKHNIRNYTIFLQEPENVLFGTFEYHGADFPADRQSIAACSHMRRWWALTDCMQSPCKNRREDEWWTVMNELFHMD